ncbi:MAG: F0F1 ATP synthase subunit B' [Alphaproteobacteria bacterium]
MAETTHTETGAPPPKGTNFPPFDATTFIPQLFWLAVAFTLLYVALERMALPGIERVIRDRKKRIRGDLDAAQRLRKEADAALKAYEKAMADARAQANAIAAEAHAAIKAEADKQRAAVDAELARNVEAAEAQIADAKKRAIAGVRAVAIEVAGAIVEKVLHERPSALDLSRVVDDELRAA